MLDIGMIIYLFYGVLHFAITIILDFEFAQALSQFRTLFIPALLYFIIRFVITYDEIFIDKFHNIIYTIFFLNLGYLLFETALSLSGIHAVFLPWHNYAMITLDRLGSSAYAVGDAPSMLAIGLGGFPHFTAPFFAATFCLIYPSMKHNTKYSKYELVILILTIFSFFILRVKATMLALVLVFGLQFLFGKNRDRRFLIYLSLAAFVGIFSIELLREELFTMLDQIFIGNSEEGSRIELLAKSFFGGLSFLFVEDNLFTFFFGLIDRDYASGIGYGGGAQVFEIALFNYIVIYGLIWGTIIIALSSIAGLYALRIGFLAKNLRNRITFKDILLSKGIFFLLIIYLSDIAHFGQAIYAPNIDLIFVSLALISLYRNKSKTLIKSAS
ncbi:hypothetical protein N9425_02715 [Gammaproteobacteria bacterium]|nr:hypothetical protein [Gammaproteobacteria bacterium]